MIKIYNDKKGSIFIDLLFLTNSLEQFIKFYFNKNSILKVSFDHKNGLNCCCTIHFDKSINISRKEENKLFNEILFILETKFGIKNSNVVFIYENKI